jgi:hypothetical protein
MTADEFAAIIREAIEREREACARIVEEIKPPIGMHGYNDVAIKHIAAAIRGEPHGTRH